MYRADMDKTGLAKDKWTTGISKDIEVEDRITVVEVLEIKETENSLVQRKVRKIESVMNVVCVDI